MEKTILEWLNQLPEPIKSQAIGNAKNTIPFQGEEIVRSLGDAIRRGFFWVSSPQKDEYWVRIYQKANSGKFDKPPIPWPAEADWSNAPEGTFARAIDENGKCYFYAIGKTENRQQNVWASIPPRFCGYIDDMTGIDWGNSLEFNTNLPR